MPAHFVSDTQIASDAFLAAIVSSSSDAILTKDLTGKITSWNQGAERIFGYTSFEAIGKPVTLLFPADRYNEEAAIMARILQGTVVDHYETVRLRKDGKRINISLTVSPIRDSEGKVVGASKIARDITSQKQANEQLRTALSTIGEAIIATDENGCVLFINPIAERLTGWVEGEAVGRSADAIFRTLNDLNREPTEPLIARVLQDKGSTKQMRHAILVSKDGTEYPIENNAAPIRGTEGEVVGAVLVFRDVSRRRVTEIAASRLAAIVDGSDDAIVSKDLRGIITSWNPGAEKIFGYTEAEMIGQSITRLIPEDRQNEEPAIMARFQRGERVDHFHTVRRRKDGRLVQVSVTISPVRNEHGEIIGASKIARDVTVLHDTQRKLERHAEELEEKVRERTAKLEESIAELEAFSYSLSHDMRAPVRAIQSYTEIVLVDHGEQIGEGAEYLRRVVNAAARMDRLIQDVLSFSRLARTDIQVGPIKVERLVREIIGERPDLEKYITIEGRLLPMMGHDASFSQCITNLLDNAVKFVAPGVRPAVRIYSEIVEDRVRLCVRDNGIGIESGAQRRLFGIFERLPTQERYHGTGVGLAIVRKAAERMGGKAGVNSLLGQGSTFWIELSSA